MEIRIRESGVVITESEFRQIHKNTSFPPQLSTQLINDFGGDVVLQGPTPSAGRYETVYRDGVELINGKWFTKYSVGPVFVDTTDENGVVTTAAQHMAAYRSNIDNQQASSVRSERNRRLSDCDWTQVLDAPVDRIAWTNYRQALREVPKQVGFPWDINWPTKPE